MSGLESLLSQPAVGRFGWTLVHFLWQGAGVAAMLATALLVLRRAPANARYAAACAALLLMVAAPVATYWHLAPSASVAMPSLGELPELPELPAAESGAASPGDVAPVTAPAVAPVAPPAPALPPAPGAWHVRARQWIEGNLRWFVGAWFAGVVFLSVRLVAAWLGVRRIRRSGAAAPESLCARMNALAARLRVSRPVRLLTSIAADAPVVIGWFRPVVLFPASLLTQLSAAQLDAILAHELAHVRRGDYLVNLLQTVVETLLFYHPAVYWVSRRIRIEREHCCDDLAVGAMGDTACYARALARLAEMTVPAPRLLPAAGGHLLARIRRLVGMREAHPTERGPVWAGGAILLAALLACSLALAAPEKTVLPERPEKQAPATAASYADMLATLYPDAANLRMPTDEEIAKLDAAGLWPRVPPEENAAYWFAKAAHALAGTEDIPAGSAAAAEKPYAGDVAALEKWVQRNQKAIDLMRQGLQHETYRSLILWPTDNPQPIVDLAMLAQLRQLARVSTDAAFVAELQGDTATAAQNYTDGLRLSVPLRRQGILIEQLVGQAVCKIALRGLDAVLANAMLDEATLREVIHQCREAEVAVDEPAKALATEIAYSNVAMMLRRDGAEGSAVFDTWRKQNTALLEFVSKKTLTDLLRRDSRKAFSEIGHDQTVPPSTAAAVPRLLQEFGGMDVWVKATEIRAAISLWQMTHGGLLPATLDDLCPAILPAVPLDPFSGKPLRYERTVTGWRLWSVGADNADNGGQADPAKNWTWTGQDYVFTSVVPSNVERRSGGKITKHVTTPAGTVTETTVHHTPPADALQVDVQAWVVRMPVAMLNAFLEANRISFVSAPIPGKMDQTYASAALIPGVELAQALVKDAINSPDAMVVSAPHVTVLNGKEQWVSLSQTQTYPAGFEAEVKEGKVALTQATRPVTTSETSLRVTPKYDKERRVFECDVTFGFKMLAGTVKNANTETPVVQTREVSTKAVIPEAATLLVLLPPPWQETKRPEKGLMDVALLHLSLLD